MLKNSESEKLGALFLAFCETIAALRNKETGCPWDLEQTHKTLRKYMIEEAYEATDAMSGDSNDKICEELGDVLLQVVLNAQVAKDESNFTLADVIESINSKMIRRHPHVFNRSHNQDMNTPQKVLDKWSDLKAKEKQNPDSSFFAKAADLKSFPATLQAYEIGKVAKQINFDWTCPEDVFAKFFSEVQELREALMEAKFKQGPDVEAELGDVFFSLTQLCRHLDYDPEVTAFLGNKKFLDRFAKLEKLAADQSIDLKTSNAAQLELLWQQAKTL